MIIFLHNLSTYPISEVTSLFVQPLSHVHKSDLDDLDVYLHCEVKALFLKMPELRLLQQCADLQSRGFEMPLEKSINIFTKKSHMCSFISVEEVGFQMSYHRRDLLNSVLTLAHHCSVLLLYCRFDFISGPWFCLSGAQFSLTESRLWTINILHIMVICSHCQNCIENCTRMI